nr:MAG TPA: hypothetical protein [Bacteriophage sp.]
MGFFFLLVFRQHLNTRIEGYSLLFYLNLV